VSLHSLSTAQFSRHWLSDVCKELDALPVKSAAFQVSLFAVRRICAELAGFMDGMQPISPTRHAQMEGIIDKPLRRALVDLDASREVSAPDLQTLIIAATNMKQVPGH
jgi:hypothetical protein